MEEVKGQRVHGSLDYEELARLGLHPADMCDLSVNSNPYGPSPHIRPALATVAIERYPDRACSELRRTIQTYEPGMNALPLDTILCANGTAELIWALARAFLGPGHTAAQFGPTFGDYRAASQAAGAELIEYRLHAEDSFQPDSTAVTSWLERERPTLLWLCNPNNPTGTWLARHTIEQLLDTCQRTDTMLVVDEAYWRFLVPREAFSAVALLTRSTNAPLLILRSLTKDFALAGVRLGYAVAAPTLMERVNPHLPSWNVNSFAQAAGIAALTDQAHLNKTLGDLAIERQAFFDALHKRGLHVLPSRTHFCLIEVGDAHEVRRRLLLRHILVRDCASFGLPQYIRVATRQRGEWQRFLSALEEVL